MTECNHIFGKDFRCLLCGNIANLDDKIKQSGK
jgi:hypothetical protein